MKTKLLRTTAEPLRSEIHIYRCVACDSRFMYWPGWPKFCPECGYEIDHMIESNVEDGDALLEATNNVDASDAPRGEREIVRQLSPDEEEAWLERDHDDGRVDDEPDDDDHPALHSDLDDEVPEDTPCLEDFYPNEHFTERGEY